MPEILEDGDSDWMFFSNMSTSSSNVTQNNVGDLLTHSGQPSSTGEELIGDRAKVTPASVSVGASVQQNIHAAFQTATSNFESSALPSNYIHSLSEQTEHTPTTFQLPGLGLLREDGANTLATTDPSDDLSTAGLPRRSEMRIASTIMSAPMDTETDSSGPSSFNASIADFTSGAAGFGSEVSVPRATPVSVYRTPGKLVTLPGEETEDSTTDRLTAAVSSLFPDVSELHPDSFSTSTEDGSFETFAWNNLTASSTRPSNVTDTNVPAPGLYDVIIEQFDVGEDGNVAVLVAKAVTLGLLALVGVMGNSLVIWSVVRQRHLHRPPFYYLLSLSLTDLSRAAFCLPLVLMTLLQGSVWRHGDSACDLFAFANSFFVLSSSLSLLDIAADRHLSLLYPYSYRRRAAGAVNLVVVLLGWTVAFLVSFPPVVGVGAYAFEASEGQCTLRHKFFKHDNDTLGFLLVFSLLLLITLVMYYRIYLSLRAHRKMRPLEHEPARSANWSFVSPGANGQAFTHWFHRFGGGGGGGTNSGPPVPLLARNPFHPPYTRVISLHVARNQHVIRLFFLMTMTFTVLWLPYQVLSYWRVFSSMSGHVPSGLVTAAAWLSYGQVVVCPVVYFSSRGPTRRRTPRGDVSPDDKQHELLLDSLHRHK